MDNVFEKAVSDYFNNKFTGELLIHNTYGEPDKMTLDVYFRKESELSQLESYALELCSGEVLDIGAGLGALSLILQERSMPVEALEVSQCFGKIMQDRGVDNIIIADFLDRETSKKYDTLLMMMNGFGLCGTVDKLPRLFKALDEHLAPGGQVILDSSDLSYLYEVQEKPADHYFGEMDYRYEYNGEFGSWFKWLYIDHLKLEEIAQQSGYNLQVLFSDETDQYLGRLTRKEE